MSLTKCTDGMETMRALIDLPTPHPLDLVEGQLHFQNNQFGSGMSVNEYITILVTLIGLISKYTVRVNINLLFRTTFTRSIPLFRNRAKLSQEAEESAYTAVYLFEQCIDGHFQHTIWCPRSLHPSQIQIKTLYQP